jgi:hypothetical protein
LIKLLLKKITVAQWLPDGSENRSVAQVVANSRSKCPVMIKSSLPQIKAKRGPEEKEITRGENIIS